METVENCSGDIPNVDMSVRFPSPTNEVFKKRLDRNLR